jgi:hypothetical protein
MPIVLLSSALRDALQNDQPDQIEPNLTKRPKATRYGELDRCLYDAMPSGSLKMIATLLRLEARLCSLSLWRAVERQDSEVFDLLLESGWDINSHDFEYTGVQWVLSYYSILASEAKTLLMIVVAQCGMNLLSAGSLTTARILTFAHAAIPGYQ